MMDRIIEQYNSNISVLESEISKIRKIFSWLYLTRLFTFIAFVTFLALFFQFNYNYLILLLSLACLISFLFTVKIDLNYDYKAKFLTNKLNVNQNELMFLKHHYDDRETGDEYNYLNPHLSADFDLLGKGSLFQYLNRCSTKIGKTRLAEGLCVLEKNESHIKEKQQAIRELSGKIEFIQNFQSYGMFIQENGSEITNLQSWLDQTPEKIKYLQRLSLIMPVIMIGWISLIIAGVFSITSVLAPLITNFLIIQLNNKNINQAHAGLNKTAETFKNYTALIKLAEEENYTSVYLSGLKNKLSYQNIKASDSLKSLFRLLNSFDVRFNILASFALNSLLLFDIQVYCRLSRWKLKNKNAVPHWFFALAELDALTGFSIFAHNNQDVVTYPDISEKEFTFQAEELGHPLLPPDVRICNDVYFSGTPAVLIITGANMAGKSTFLRTLAVNLVLAMNGAPVCARHLLFPPCDIMSSIKIQDSLSNNESYFYAELLRLKDIINHINKNPRTLVVLDEILRGTNTKDKQLGSLGLLEKLISLNSVVLIATHDLTIGELEKKYPGIVVNNCFEVELTNDQLIFDYKLKKGISKKLNASFLMKKMEIIS